MTLTEYIKWVTPNGTKHLNIYRSFKAKVRSAMNSHRRGITKLDKKHITKFQDKLDALQLPQALIDESSIHYQKNEVKIKEGHAQGLWLDLSFVCGDTGKKKKKKKTGNPIHLPGHQLYTHYLGQKDKGYIGKKKFIVFKKNAKKVSLIVIKNGLSQKGEEALNLFKDMHHIVDPTAMKLICKISGWPIAELIKQGFNLAGSKRKYGNKDMTPIGMTQSGRSAKNYYQNKNGEHKEFQVENPCSRMSYYSNEEIEQLWNSDEFNIAQKMGKEWNEVKPLFDAYFADMKAAYLAHMKYFFEPCERSNPDDMNEAYFGEAFHFSSNMFGKNSSCACHHDTKPKQKGFPSGITAMGVNQDGKERLLRHGDGELCFVDLGCNVQYNKGDIVLMDPELYHGLLPLKGKRYSLVLYNNKGTL